MRLVYTALLAVAALTACDRPSRLEEGLSTEMDVRKEFGEPVTITNNTDGSRVFEYPRQPEGFKNFRIVIGPDGKMASLRQLLTIDNVARVQPGMTQLQVLELLGRPAAKRRYDLKNEEAWEWRFKPVNEARLFTATFDAGGRVTATATTDDPREALPK